MTGTRRYYSIFIHHGNKQSRRDDLEIIGYFLIKLFFLRIKKWQKKKCFKFKFEEVDQLQD